jgi:hypothetical protein
MHYIILNDISRSHTYYKSMLSLATLHYGDYYLKSLGKHISFPHSVVLVSLSLIGFSKEFKSTACAVYRLSVQIIR